ncbi:MAG: 30S ribosomal protein S8 [Patescibacteria group bacterium]|nr:30S ribosomal protein S8 [Patescibacteria group bacterium]
MIRIKNGYMARRSTVDAPYSSFGAAVLDKLKTIGFLEGYEITGETIKTITIKLSYDEDMNPAFTDLELVSKPGQRIYVAVDDLKPVLSGFGYSILSTPKGIMTNVEARRARTGGELLFKIW